MKRQGWKGNSMGHSLAARGVKTQKMPAGGIQELDLGPRFVSITGVEAKEVANKVKRETGLRTVQDDDTFYIPIPQGKAAEVSQATKEALEGTRVVAHLRIPGGHYLISEKRHVLRRIKK